MRSVALLVLALLLAGCWEPKTGPEKIRYDREACEICRMIISDPRFAAEIRGGPKNRIFKFDDLGDAVHWLEAQSWKDSPENEIWVMSMKDGKTWLDARKVWYLPDQISPMDYNFGAIAEQQDKSISWTQMKKTVIERGLSSRCISPDWHTSDPDHNDNSTGSKK